jgi:hypothetical protein
VLYTKTVSWSKWAKLDKYLVVGENAFGVVALEIA